MKIELVHVTPSGLVSQGDVLKLKLHNVGALAIILDHVRTDAVTPLALAVAETEVSLVSVWGANSEAVHDMIDHSALEKHTSGPLTTWDNVGPLVDFVRTFALVHRGSISLPDQNRPALVCYVSAKASVPVALETAVETLRETKSVNVNAAGRLFVDYAEFAENAPQEDVDRQEAGRDGHG